MGAEPLFPTAYNLFRRTAEPDLQCAVPEDRELPRFITEESWEFGGKLTAPGDAPSGFSHRQASQGAYLNGYYLFQVTSLPGA